MGRRQPPKTERQTYGLHWKLHHLLMESGDWGDEVTACGKSSDLAELGGHPKISDQHYAAPSYAAESISDSIQYV